MIPFPFPAIVGLEAAKKSLLYHAIDPRIGGTLLLGHRGCAKTTLVRSFAEILSGLNGEAPFVELPLGATEDRLLGSVNAQRLVEDGLWHSRAGLIEQAHGGVLYVDEINLLPDHLADFLLDSAATGQHRVERDGISRHVESRYILIGTMNPEEGELRPQLADRFAHAIRIADEFEPEQRIEIVERRLNFDDGPAEFRAQFADEMARIKSRLLEARACFRNVSIPSEMRAAVSATASELKLEGMRAELAVLRTARCAAAWNERRAVTEEDIREAWEFCLPHRAHSPAETPPAAQPPNSQRPRPDNGESMRATATPRTPLGSQTAPIPINLRERSQSGLASWLRNCRASGSATRAFRASGATQRPQGRVSWIASLLASLPDRLLGRAAGWRLCYHAPPRPIVWIFLDASRSTGASKFLGRACENIAAAVQHLHPARFSLLVLQHGQLRWLARRCTKDALRKVLDGVKEAGGKSFIIQGLEKLRRARATFAIPGAVIVCSDGLATPASTDQPGRTFAQLRHALQRLAHTSARVAWLHAKGRRSLAEWLPRVCHGIPVTRFELR